jgi:hypothetical protein
LLLQPFLKGSPSDSPWHHMEVISPVQRSAALRSGAANMALISDRVRNPTSFYNLQLAAIRGLPFAPRHPRMLLIRNAH